MLHLPSELESQIFKTLGTWVLMTTGDKPAQDGVEMRLSQEAKTLVDLNHLGEY